jgi:hypothetical protein
MGLMGEYIAKKLNPTELEAELRKYISKYNKHKNTFLMIYASAIGKPNVDPLLALCMDDYYIIYDMLKDNGAESLDFYIETPGGSGEAAEEVVKFTRDKFKTVNFVISGEAKSAGTILALSGDEILMTKSGSLGPIDAQIRIGRTTVSSHDYLEWVKEKHKEATNNGTLNLFDATVIAQISPGELNGVIQAQTFAEDLVKQWLPKYKFKNWTETETRKATVDDEYRQKTAEEVTAKLVDHSRWHSHGRSLKIADLNDIVGLKIIRVDDDPVLADIVYRIQTILRLLFSTTTTYKIFATEHEKIFKNATPGPIGLPPVIPAKQSDVISFDVKCGKCGDVHRIYAKFTPNPTIDKDFKARGFEPFPKGNKLICKCGFEMDLTPQRNEIETNIGKKLIL